MLPSIFPSVSTKIDSSKDDNNFCLLSISFFKLCAVPVYVPLSNFVAKPFTNAFELT